MDSSRCFYYPGTLQNGVCFLRIARMWLFLVIACLIQQTENSEGSVSHLNPQEFMTIIIFYLQPQIIQYWGYSSEEYEVLTDDGYYLKLNRIISGKHFPHLTGISISFHEMAIYDIPATIAFILQKTKQNRLYYFGHGQGGTLGFIAFSLLPHLAQKVKLFLCFTPAYTLRGITGLPKALGKIPAGLRKLIWGKKKYYLLSNRLKAFLAYGCSHAMFDKLCLQGIFFMGGYNAKNLNTSRADVYVGIFPDFTSVKTLSHWGQVIYSKEFKYFDHGKKNKAIYNRTKPPFYKIEDVTIPVAVWSGGRDIVATKKDVELMTSQITHLVFYKNIPDWQHMDPILGLDIPQQLYNDIRKLMQKY
ncbi:lysosomal acid lipase/cholesteryl ester hydrolase-like isoform X7 [Pantherophis guttatus]|uniref:Lysosomal acid lipase/cholesteryl ester hydrolase-like isoform X7 n=1 Tax=Pantherophis guttatus TaxID=94885 RepID=A0A6P9CT59_PANGU|nr:lysosomal acid lipase/cholesteryl ester hydrolase-like isoform X7 [Pantherophis guttatus]